MSRRSKKIGGQCAERPRQSRSAWERKKAGERPGPNAIISNANTKKLAARWRKETQMGRLPGSCEGRDEKSEQPAGSRKLRPASACWLRGTGRSRNVVGQILSARIGAELLHQADLARITLTRALAMMAAEYEEAFRW